MYFDGGNYTLELRRIAESKHTKVFNFKYPFYDEDHRPEFEEKFIKHYYFDQIGFETVAKFQQRLEAKLLLDMPYWKQLYRTELESQGISFLLNKDLKETFLRTVDTEDKILGNSTMNTASDSTYSDKSTSESSNEAQNASNSQYKTNNTKTNHNEDKHTGTIKDDVDGTSSTTEKVSNLMDGVASAKIAEGFLTNVTNTEGKTTNDTTRTFGNTDTTDGNTTDKKDETTTANATSTSKDKANNNNSGNRNGSERSTGTTAEDKTGKLLEKTELISKGNIGTTSSAELLEKWRECLINIDKMIIESCQDLFMQVY